LETRRGKLLVGQSGGCTQVINASLVGVIEQAKKSSGIAGLWGTRHGIEGILKGEIVDLAREDPRTLRKIARTPAAALGSCRHRLSAAEARGVVERFRQWGVRYFTYIGGNDSADTAHRLARAAAQAGDGLRVVSVPKTIDNDLPFTDHCPGYGSTARFIASVVADTGAETEAMRSVEPVKIIEVMGRNAGWLPAAAALAKRNELDAPQFIWPPEVPFDEAKFLRLVRSWLARIGYCVVVVSETIRDARGRAVADKGRAAELDAFRHPRLVGAAEYLCELVKEKVGARARWDKPGTIQRMAAAYLSESDLREARACGAWAVRYALRGRSDCMVVMRRAPGRAYRISYDTVPLSKIANSEKLLPAAWFDRRTMLPRKAFVDYARPLAGEGLPEHPRLRAIAVSVRSV